MASSKPLRLCTTCKNIDFISLVYPEHIPPQSSTINELGDEASASSRNRKPPSEVLGLLEEIATRATNCDFCELVLFTAGKQYERCCKDKNSVETATGLPFQQDGEPISATLRTDFFCSYDASKGTSNSDGLPRPYDPVQVNRLMVVLQPCPWAREEFRGELTFQAFWEDNTKPGHTEETFNGDVSGTPDESIHQRLAKIGRLGSGRIVPSELNMELVTGWLKTCETNHGSLCTSPRWLPDATEVVPRDLRVIDVHRGCLIEAPWGCRYLALSYVWGQASPHREEYCLTLGNIALLQADGGIVNMANMPATIWDAMEFTRRLGERYLWVDALCIVHDDELELLRVTKQMDVIYGGALLVIILAAGEDSNTRFPGLRPASRSVSQRRALVPSGRSSNSNGQSAEAFSIMQTVMQGSSRNLQFSTWNTRGWTLQERLLARRSVVMTADQAFWMCDGGFISEETHLETQLLSSGWSGDSTRNRNKLFILPQALGCNDEWDDNYPKFTRDALGTYITQYSLRKFTFPSDTHAAFNGIERRCSFRTGVSFHWGLAEDMFDQELSFTAGQSPKAGVSRHINTGDGEIIQVQYPSWSWMGWNGFVGSKIFNASVHRRRKRRDADFFPLIQFHSLLSDGSLRRIGASKEPAERPDQRVTNEIEVDDSSSISSLGSLNIGCNETPENQIPSWISDAEISSPISAIKLESGNRRYMDNNEAPSHGKENGAYDTGKIAFWTSHAKLPVSFDGHKLQLLPQLPGSSHKQDLKATVGEEIWGNSQLISKRTRDNGQSHEELSGNLLDFIVLGRHYPIGQHVHDGTLDLLIVRWSDEVENLGYRLGTAQLSETAWLTYHPAWTLVVLA